MVVQKKRKLVVGDDSPPMGSPTDTIISESSRLAN